MNSCWVEAKNEADKAKFKRWGITAAYFDIRNQDGRYTPAYLNALLTDGIESGFYSCSQGEGWPTTLTGPEFAEWTSDKLRAIGWKHNPPVCLNMETHDIAGFIVPALQRWRELRPKRATDWFLEGFQGGLFDQQTVQAILMANVRLVPAAYNGAMTIAYDPRLVARNLVAAGFPDPMVFVGYDAARLGSYAGWDGYAFIQGRLP